MLSDVVIRLFDFCFIWIYFKDYIIDIFFRQWWRDLWFVYGEDKVFNVVLDFRKLGFGIWIFDIYFRNVKFFNYYVISCENM